MFEQTNTITGHLDSHLIDDADEWWEMPWIGDQSAELLPNLLSSFGLYQPPALIGRGGAISPAALFDALSNGESPALWPLLKQNFEVLAYPGSRLRGPLREGDIFLRRGLSEGNLGHLAIVVNRRLYAAEELGANGLQAESDLPGMYAQVVEAGPFPHSVRDRFARKISDTQGRLSHDTLLVRPRAGNRLQEDSPAIIGGRYGGYDLHQGDRDRGYRYGGRRRTAKNWDTLPPQGTLPFVEKLQSDLKILGFRLVASDKKGVYGRYTKWAVREFQIYANMEYVARLTGAAERYVDQLSRVRNKGRRLQPAVTGVVNQATRDALQLWLDEQYRCPVVIDALGKDKDGNYTVVRKENIWLRSDHKRSSSRMFARDFTRYYDDHPPYQAEFPPGRDPDDPIAIGKWSKYKSSHGPSTDKRKYAWPEAEITPETMVGKPAARLTQAESSSFRVIRAVSNVEDEGFFDVINAYDNVFISVGPFHQPIGEANDRSGGELCAVLSEFQKRDPNAFEHAFLNFGMRATDDWGENGADLFQQSGKRRYGSTISFLEEDIRKTEDQEGRVVFKKMSLKFEDMNYLRSWHWFYRFIMAARTISGFRRAFWRMSRIRLRELLRTPFGHGVAPVPHASGMYNREARIGDLFTSERAVALILRWHVRAPGHMAFGGQAGGRLKLAYQKARVGGKGPTQWGPPASWNDRHELALITSIMARAREVSDAPDSKFKGLKSTMGRVNNDSSLSDARASFHLNETDLTPVPDPGYAGD